MVKIITNNHLHELLYYDELTDKEKKDFDWAGDYDRFFRYKGNVYALADFMSCDGNGCPFPEWSGYFPDSFFSGILVKFPDEGKFPFRCDDFVQVGWYY